MSAFKCGNHSKNKLKVISKPESKHINFEEIKKCSDGENYQKKNVINIYYVQLFMKGIFKT